MEELQDAIEDAQYMSAMHDEMPRPTKEWKWPAADELQTYLDKLKTVNPKIFTPEGFCKGSLGFYLFMKFCREQGGIMKVMADFVEDVASFRGKLVEGNVKEFAHKIKDSYLIEGSRGNEEAGRSRHPGLVRTPPSTTSNPRSGGNSIRDKLPRNANEPAKANETSNASPTRSRSRIIGPETVSESVKLAIATNAIKVVGQPLDDCLAILEADLALNQQFQSKVSLGDQFSRIGLGSLPPGSNKGGGGVSGKSLQLPTLPLSSQKQVMKLRMDVFDEVEGIVFAYLTTKCYNQFKESPYWTRHFQYLFTTERKVVEEDFALFRVLGRGGFGMVNACKRCTTGKLYAMKILSKRRIKMKKAEALCLNERNILAIVQSPFVVCLKYAFCTTNDAYLVLDLMTGGDLGFHLSRKGRFTEKESKYYAARTLLGIAALHEKNIAYRDLKPENILMDEEGYTKISDLGLACKVGKSGLTGTCGTRGYWAPEMLRRDANDKREKYTVTVDWFSFGCVVYEFMYGISPFRTERARKWGDFPKIEKADRDRAIDLAIQQMTPDFDETIFSDQAKDLILKLLIKDGTRRLGARGYTEITAHPWFREIEWENISRVKPPSKPARDINMAPQSEIGGFADEREARRVMLSEEDHKMYTSWEFISKRSFQEEVVQFLQLEEKLGPIPIEKSVSSCCTIS